MCGPGGRHTRSLSASDRHDHAARAIPGLGPKRAQALIRHFGSVRKVAMASVDELVAVEGIGPALGATIQSSLNPKPSLNPKEGSA